MEYFIAINGQQQGPFSIETLRLQSITPDTLVWAQGMPNWLPASQVAELQPLFMSQPQQQTVPPQTQYQQTGYQQPVNGNSYGTGSVPGAIDPATDMVNKVAGALDDGGLYRKWMPKIYMVLGVICCILPILYIIKVVDQDYFKNGWTTVLGIINIIISLAAGVMGLFYWMNRRQALKQQMSEKSDTISITGHFLQSAGECVGLLYFCTYAVMTFLSGFFVGFAANRKVGGYIMDGIGSAVEAVITGLIILCLGRFLGEIAKRISAKEQ